MRKIARVTKQKSEIVRVMTFDDGEGVYLFLFDRIQDAACCADEWYESIANAEKAAELQFGIAFEDWSIIPDPVLGGQHDRIDQSLTND